MKTTFNEAVDADVLFVSYGGGHVNMLLPVAQHMQANGFKVVFLALTSARAVLQQTDIGFITYADFPIRNNAAIAHGKRLAAELPVNPAVPLEDTEAYLGLNYEALEIQFGTSTAAEMYQQFGRSCFQPLGVFLSVLPLLNPKVVVASNSPRSERYAIKAAGLLSIPSVCVVDLFALREIEWIGEPGFADAVCVLNQEVKYLFKSAGRRDDEVIVTGNPAFDSLFNPEYIKQGRALRAQRGWDQNDTINVLWASQVEPEVHPFEIGLTGNPKLPGQVERALRQAVICNQALRLIVRYHPSQVVDFLPQDRVEHSHPTEDLSTLLHAVDVVVTMTSTVGLQASLVGKQVLTVDSSVFFNDMPYSKMGISKGFKQPQDLLPYLKNLSYLHGIDNNRTVQSNQQMAMATPRVAEIVARYL